MATGRTARAELLRRVPLFHGISERALDSLVDLVTEVEFPSGRYLAQQGQVGSGLFVVIEGRVRVTRGDQTLAHLGPGEFVGELSLLDGSPRMAHVVAEEPTRVLALGTGDLLDLVEREPSIALAMLRTLAGRLRDATDPERG
jgi:CRP/FNR family transcriptional regulator, cyclic AMP receptor protein